ncbi:MAG TPA: serine hydrolase [Pseudonocardiaceae bacterium]|nr:serine hydrolase [Pseudonocardiaceae bacterium]
MRLYARTPISALTLTLCALVVTAMVGSSAGIADAAKAPATPTMTNNATAPASATCPDHVTPPPPVDTSEQPAPGQPTPAPLPEPSVPIGGTQLGQCGNVLPPGAPPLPTDITADSWLLEDLDTGAVLAAKDPHARERPASLIKLLLSLVVTRELDPNSMVTATQDDANQPPTRVGIVPGAQYSVSDLVEALLMKSGNDVAYALAMQLGGLPAAEQKMDALAKQLGALDTRAGTPSGLDGPGMSASAYDIAVIFRAALTNQLISTAVQTKSLVLPASNGKPAVSVENENELLVGGVATARFPGEIGGKTGFTTDAQHTYADAAEQNGHRIALVMMRNPDDLDGVYKNAKELLDYGFQLDAAKLPPVGQVVDSNPLVNKATTAATTKGAKPKSGQSDLAAAKTPDDPISTFGTVGKPLTILAGIAVLLIGILLVRRRFGRKRRAAKAAAAKAAKAAKARASAERTADAARAATNGSTVSGSVVGTSTVDGGSVDDGAANGSPVDAANGTSVNGSLNGAVNGALAGTSTSNGGDVNWDAVDEAFAEPAPVRPVRRPLRAPVRRPRQLSDADAANATETTEVFHRIQ